MFLKTNCFRHFGCRLGLLVCFCQMYFTFVLNLLQCIAFESWITTEVGKPQLKAQLSQPPQLRKLRCALIFYFETLQKLHCRIKPLKICCALIALRFQNFFG